MFEYTPEEAVKARQAYFSQGENLKLENMPSKQKKRYIVLKIISEIFTKDQFYTEKEVNALLKTVYDDFVMLRRYLVDYKLLNRELDGSKYWVNN